MTPPFNPEYVAICRELALVHVFVEGDWCLYDIPGDPDTEPRLVERRAPITQASDPRRIGRYVFPPRLDQWLDILQAADPAQTYRDQDDYRMCWLAEIAEWWA